MGKKSYESFHCFFFFFFFLSISFNSISVSSQTCDPTNGYFKPNSTYDKNRRFILSSFASNVSANDGYFNGSTGLGPDQVYAMGMCAPGAELDVCSYCIQTTSKSILQQCLNQTGSFAWLGEDIICLVRYSSQSFSGQVYLDPFDVLFNRMDIGKENQKEFYDVWNGLMSRKIIEASTSVRNNSSSTNSSSLSLSSKYYTKDAVPVPVYGNIWVLMQCTQDISPKDCKFCLERSHGYYNETYYGKRGGIILRPSCFYRWELYSFSSAVDGINSPHPSLPSSKTPSVTNETNITKKKDTRRRGGIIAAIIVVSFVTIILISVGLVICKRRKQKQEIELSNNIFTSLILVLNEAESVQFDLKTIEAATNNFSNSNKLGKGGFGDVFKGILMDGTEIAVKRLSKTSGQGEVEFKNEVVVVAKLQHINLVRLLGFSLQGEEKLLVYEYVPNISLDYFLFDPEKRNQLDWTLRRNIIGGITRGILYLHQDSRLKIIHRDLKASNILLDANMNPKIADFGMARIFGVEQTVANTARVVGTFGYMSPEYVTHGQFSMKSDVYSFGVLILEIISAKKNSSFYQIDGLVNNLVTYVWRLWENNALHELVDPGIREDCKSDEVIRYIHIGLLCVQENPADRPTMATIHQMLTNSSITLPVPLPPGFFINNGPGSNPSALVSEPGQSSSKSSTCSVDEATITIVDPR